MILDYSTEIICIFIVLYVMTGLTEKITDEMRNVFTFMYVIGVVALSMLV